MSFHDSLCFICENVARRAKICCLDPGLITVTTHSGEAQQEMPALKLTYFNVEGAAEKIRLAFKLGGIEFDDERIERANWPALKPSAPFGQLPLLSIDGKPPISQSNAILRYAGRLSGLYPEDPLQAMRVDEVIGLHDDFFRSIKPTQEIISRPQDFGYPPDLSDTEKKALQSKMRSALMAEGGDIPRYLGYFESILEKNGRFRTFARPPPTPPLHSSRPAHVADPPAAPRRQRLRRPRRLGLHLRRGPDHRRPRPLRQPARVPQRPPRRHPGGPARRLPPHRRPPRRRGPPARRRGALRPAVTRPATLRARPGRIAANE